MGLSDQIVFLLYDDRLELAERILGSPEEVFEGARLIDLAPYLHKQDLLIAARRSKRSIAPLLPFFEKKEAAFFIQESLKKDDGFYVDYLPFAEADDLALLLPLIKEKKGVVVSFLPYLEEKKRKELFLEALEKDGADEPYLHQLLTFVPPKFIDQKFNEGLKRGVLLKDLLPYENQKNIHRAYLSSKKGEVPQKPLLPFLPKLDAKDFEENKGFRK